MLLPSGMVTLLFTEVEGSARLLEPDSEVMAVALDRYEDMVSEQVGVAGGHVFQAAGKVFRAVFADPSAALAAAVALQRAVDGELWPASPVGVRVALHSGFCVERNGDYFGPLVDRLARLLAISHPGQILLSGATYELLTDRLDAGVGLRDLGEHRLKDLGRPERVFQVSAVGLEEGFGPLCSLDDPALRHNLPSQTSRFVGRVAEVAELASLVSGGSRLITVVGPGGIGKSRLVRRR